MKILPFLSVETSNDVKYAGYYNPFKINNIYPFSEIGRVVVNKNTGEIKYRLHEYTSSLKDDGTNYQTSPDEDIMVYIPVFYYRRIVSGNATEDIIDICVLRNPRNDGFDTPFEVHPVFIRDDGSIRPYILVGAFLSHHINGQLRSTRVSSDADYNITYTLDELREASKYEKSNGWGLMNIKVISALQMLYRTAFQDLSKKAVNLELVGTDTDFENSISTSFDIGNMTGLIATSSYKYAHSLFGIENILSLRNLIDGFYMQNSYYFVFNKEADISNYETYEKIEEPVLTIIPITRGYTEAILSAYYNNEKFQYLSLPIKLGDDSSIGYGGFNDIPLMSSSKNLFYTSNLYGYVSEQVVGNRSFYPHNARIVFLP